MTWWPSCSSANKFYQSSSILRTYTAHPTRHAHSTYTAHPTQNRQPPWLCLISESSCMVTAVQPANAFFPAEFHHATHRGPNRMSGSAQVHILHIMDLSISYQINIFYLQGRSCHTNVVNICLLDFTVCHDPAPNNKLHAGHPCCLQYKDIAHIIYSAL